VNLLELRCAALRERGAFVRTVCLTSAPDRTDDRGLPTVSYGVELGDVRAPKLCVWPIDRRRMPQGFREAAVKALRELEDHFRRTVPA
jgi:hypothetical protein